MRNLLFITLFLMASTAFAADPEFRIAIRNHKFEPAELTIPAGKKVKLVIENKDSTLEEFESFALAREKLIPGKTTATLPIGPLKPGRYPFFGEFHESTAQGVVIVK